MRVQCVLIDSASATSTNQKNRQAMDSQGNLQHTSSLRSLEHRSFKIEERTFIYWKKKTRSDSKYHNRGHFSEYIPSATNLVSPLNISVPKVRFRIFTGTISSSCWYSVDLQTCNLQLNDVTRLLQIWRCSHSIVIFFDVVFLCHV